MKTTFSVTTSIVELDEAYDEWCETEADAEHGMSLRDAIKHVLQTRTCHVGGVESIENDFSHGTPRWVTVQNSAEFYTGAQESRTLHIPDTVTPSSASRIARLIRGN